MKNSDIPAMPCEMEARVAQDNFGADLNSAYEWHKAQSGLTKREMFAMHMMASCRVGRNYSSWHDMAKDAIDMADALLLALEKSK